VSLGACFARRSGGTVRSWHAGLPPGAGGAGGTTSTSLPRETTRASHPRRPRFSPYALQTCLPVFSWRTGVARGARKTLEASRTVRARGSTLAWGS